VSNDDVARSILDTVAYMVLSTADARGVPWASPVWFATDGYDDLYWISAPDARHSRNIAARAEVGIVVFDSTAPPATRQAVYLEATAERVDDAESLEHGVDIFSRASVDQGLGALTIDEVTADARFRLYHARALHHWVLDPDHDVRRPVRP
jgi:nitroimidazol reductase NimA-like FMN-containing flavoprotein (pyridoxamine 5'-phosphate oxidase superfamily)